MNKLEPSNKSNVPGDEVNNNDSDGLWIGIDLGTTNSAVAVWDTVKCRSKLLRFPFALPPKNKHKFGRIVPSALLFSKSDNFANSIEYLENSNVKIGKDALDQAKDEIETSPLLLTSFKRIMGTTTIIEDAAGFESYDDNKFHSGLPFHSVASSESEENKNDWIGNDYNKQSKVWARLYAEDDMFIDVDPIFASALLLKNLREASEIYIKQNKISAPGLDDAQSDKSLKIRNCVIGCPAHYSLSQKEALKNACTMAGFNGKVRVIVESTAAAMAYGINVAGGVKHVLVCDIGGGTTDVTIAKISPSLTEEQHDSVDEGVRILATAGNDRLGGDDMDDALMRWFLDKFQDKFPSYSSCKANELQILRRKCKIAKEELCGNNDTPPAQSVTIAFNGCSTLLSTSEFEEVIHFFVLQMKDVVEKAMSSCLNSYGNDFNIDEVVLVGGGSRVPAVRNMLSCRFPPPHPPSLCTSVNPDEAVAQGAAVQAALLSNSVPRHEIRSAMMLDVLPHSIGILVPRKGENIAGVKGKNFILDGDFVPVLHSNTQLPAKGSLVFSLDNPKQPGVTVLVFEKVEERLSKIVFVNEFTFLLHRLSDEKIDSLPHGIRTIEIGMVCTSDGKLLVSVYDSNDPEDVAKMSRLKGRSGSEHEQPDLDYEAEDTNREQVLLTFFLIVLILLYIYAKMFFQNMGFDESNEVIDDIEHLGL